MRRYLFDNYNWDAKAATPEIVENRKRAEEEFAEMRGANRRETPMYLKVMSMDEFVRVYVKKENWAAYGVA